MKSHASMSGISIAVIEQWVERLKALRLLEGKHHEALAAVLSEARIGRLEQPPPPLLTMLLLGKSGVGKSELLNALAGEPIAEVSHLRPTTTLPTVYAHEAVQPERLFEYGTALGELVRSPAYFQVHAREELRNKIIIDAPDIDTYKTEHRELVMQLIPTVDIVLYMVTAQTYKDDIGWQIVLRERGRRAFAFVINKWDREGKPPAPKGMPDIDDDFRTLLRQRGGYADPLLFRTSAEYWAHHPGHASESKHPPAGDQFPKLERWLSRGLSTSRIEQIQQRRRRTLWGAVAAEVAGALPAPLGAHPWQDEVVHALGNLRSDGWKLIHPAIITRAHRLADLYEADSWPNSPGLFGLYLRAVASWKAFLTRGAQWLNRTAPSPADSAVTPLFPEGLQSLVRARLDKLALQGRSEGLPLEWVTDWWEETTSSLRPRLTEAIELTASELVAWSYARARRILGIIVIALVELTLGAFMVMTVWRLGQGYITTEYISPGFAVNTLLLLVCLLVLGQVAVSWCFPRPDRPFRRQLEAQGRLAWDNEIAELEQTALAFLEETDALYREGQVLMQQLNVEIDQCTRALAASSQTDTWVADALFAQTETRS